MIVPLFTELLYRTNLSQHSDKNDYFYNKIQNLKLEDNNKVDWKCDTFSSLFIYDLINDAEFKPVLEDIKKEVIKFSKEFGVITEDIFCSDAWINSAGPDEYQEYHLHPVSHFSIAYYIKTPNNCGDIVFRSHEVSTDMFPLPVEIITPANFKTTKHTPKENDLLIFRSNLYHMVEKNKSNSNRVSISANFILKR